MGFPIRKSPDHSSFAAPRSLSQLITSFIGSLKKSAERPSLMRYALGQDVLKLEDDSHD